jgi:hypothetical protein
MRYGLNLYILFRRNSAFTVLKDERTPKVFDRMLRRILGPKGDDVFGGWKKMDNEEFHDP